jgi:hypothetical protein
VLACFDSLTNALTRAALIIQSVRACLDEIHDEESSTVTEVHEQVGAIDVNVVEGDAFVGAVEDDAVDVVTECDSMSATLDGVKAHISNTTAPPPK